MNKTNFHLSLAAFVKKAKGNADAVVRKVVLDIGTRVVELSPVGDPDLWSSKAPKGYVGGRFRANWQYGNFSGAGIPMNNLPDIDPSGMVSIDRINAGLPVIGAAGMRHILKNNLPYAYRLEIGWSSQAPAGMVGITVVEYGSIVDKAAQEVNR
jgi:hypothetical protein